MKAEEGSAVSLTPERALALLTSNIPYLSARREIPQCHCKACLICAYNTLKSSLTLAQQEARAERDREWREAMEPLFATWDERPRDFEKAQQKADKLTGIIDRLRAFPEEG